MFILKVRNKIGTQASDFATNDEAVAHFEKYRLSGFWGKEGYSINHPEVIIDYPEVPATETTPAIPARTEVTPAYTEVIPCEYTWEIQDKTAELSAIRLKEETKKAERIARVEKLKTINWNEVPSNATLKDIVKTLVKEMLKDDE